MPHLHCERAGAAHLRAGRRGLTNNEAFDRHREFGQANCLHAQANVADGTQARADEQPADVRHHDPPRERRVRGEPVSQRCEYPQQCVQIQAIGTYSPAGQASSPWWPALTMTTWPMR
jgi:hypothetical protein